MIDYGQNTLFGDKIISSIGYNEYEMIKDILYLHSEGNYIDCDPTYSVGNFYNGKMPKPKYIFDKFPTGPGIVKAESDFLPLDNESVKYYYVRPSFCNRRA